MKKRKKTIYFFKNYFWLFLILLFQFILINHFFPISEVFNDKPIVTQDYPYHYSQILISQKYLSEGKLGLYDPYFLCGTLRGIIYEKTEIFLILITFLFSFLPSILTFKFFIYFFSLIVPLVMYLAARNFNLTRLESLAVSFSSVMIWQFHNIIHRMMESGVFSFVFASYFCIFTISMFYKYFNENERKYFIFASLLCFLDILIHPLSIIILAIPLAVVFIFLLKKWSLQKSFLFLSITLVFIIFFSFSFFNSINYQLKLFEPPIFNQSEGLKTILFDFQERIVQTIIFILGFSGIYLWKNNKKVYFLFLITSIFYFVFSYFGSFVNIISYLQPNRLLVPLSFLLIIPSIKSVQYIVIKIKSYKNYLIAFIVLIFILSFFKTPQLLIKMKDQLQIEFNRQITTSIPEDTQNLIEWIKTNTTSEARILIENSGYMSNYQYGGYFLSLFPHFTNREFVVGPMPYLFTKKPFYIPHFSEGILFGKDITNFSSNDFDYYFNSFNIKWIIVWSNESKEVFDSSSDHIRKIDDIGKFSIYETDIKPSFFIEGNGTITSDLNMITIDNASKGEIIIKYAHYSDLKTNPKIEINYEFSNVTINFIKISNNNFTHFEIYT